MPALPDAQAADAPRTPPTITDLAGARAALREGFYAEVAAALPSLGDSPEAKLLSAQHLLETGQYDEAATLAGTLTGEERRAGQTLKAEALLARGTSRRGRSFADADGQ